MLNMTLQKDITTKLWLICHFCPKKDMLTFLILTSPNLGDLPANFGCYLDIFVRQRSCSVARLDSSGSQCLQINHSRLPSVYYSHTSTAMTDVVIADVI